MQASELEDAFNSMLRTDYIALKDTQKLNLLTDYYVDYFGYVAQMVAPIDQLVVGRRGTGKTTLLYRALVDCMRSWDPKTGSAAQPRTLGVYLDLVKCQSLNSSTSADYEHFEHAFVSELCDAIREELTRSWPALEKQPNLIDRVFRSGETRRAAAANKELQQLAEILKSGLPRFVDRSGTAEVRRKSASTSTSRVSGTLSAKPSKLEVSADAGEEYVVGDEFERTAPEKVTYRLTVADLLRVVSRLREAANIPHLLIFIDEFSSLDESLQGRFTTLLKKILGNHSGVYVKLSAITDHYRLGSSIILQRDLFELSLDLNSFVERSGSLGAAMEHLVDLTRNIIEQRLSAYGATPPERLFDDAASAYKSLASSAMGVPRTLGIVLKQAWSRSAGGRSSSLTRIRIRKSDLDFGIRYASRAYLNQMLGAARDGVAIPAHVHEMWDALLGRATEERRKTRSGVHSSSHFMVQPRYEERLKHLNMFFLVHLLEQGRTTKKEGINRSLYCFDYGISLENYLGWSDNKNVIRQQRFVYDDVLGAFDRFYKKSEDEEFSCPKCGATFKRSELIVAGRRLTFCPEDRTELTRVDTASTDHSFTEEEIKIIGAIRSAREADELVARQIADDVGCYIQKVAKFGEKLDKNGVISRRRTPQLGKNIYFTPESDN